MIKRINIMILMLIGILLFVLHIFQRSTTEYKDILHDISRSIWNTVLIDPVPFEEKIMNILKKENIENALSELKSSDSNKLEYRLRFESLDFDQLYKLKKSFQKIPNAKVKKLEILKTEHQKTNLYLEIMIGI